MWYIYWKIIIRDVSCNCTYDKKKHQMKGRMVGIKGTLFLSCYLKDYGLKLRFIYGLN